MNARAASLLVVLASGVAVVPNALADFDPDIVCRRAQALPEPEDWEFDNLDSSRLANCDSVALYHGLGRRRNVRDARLCARLEREEKREPVLGGAAMLMVIYANGAGVTRNVDYAIRLACEDDGAPAEIWHRVKHLWEMKRKQRAGPFDYCDDATSGFLDGACTEREHRGAALQRQRALEAMGRKYRGSTKKAFARLLSARKAFTTSRVSRELDLSGTMRATIQMQEGSKLDTWFSSMLERLQAGAFADISAVNTAAFLDKQLNDVYAAARASADRAAFEDVRATEKLWLRQRDAWSAFIKLAFPSQSLDEALADVLRERISHLKQWKRE